MYGINIQKMSGKTWARLFTYALPVILLLRFLVRTASGTLFVLLGLYFYLQWFGEVKPWTPSELALWIDALDGEVKASILSSLVTIFGFLIAFQVAGESWKIQASGQLKLRLVDEIESFFSELTDRAHGIERFAQRFAVATERVRTEGFNNATSVLVQRVIESSPEFVADRTKFSEMAISVHRLLGSNYSLLGTAPKAVIFMREAIDAATQISNAMWVVVPPRADADPVFVTARVDVLKLKDFVKLCDEQTDKFVRGSAAVRGILMSSVVEPNIHTFFTMLKDRNRIKKL